MTFAPAFGDGYAFVTEREKYLSVEKVREEIGDGSDELVAWANAQTEAFFAPPDDRTVQAFATVSQWATSQSYSQPAVSDFLQKADFFLVAHALAHSLTVVTHERAANSRNKIKIPDACEGLGIAVISPFDMLRQEGARFVLEERTE